MVDLLVTYLHMTEPPRGAPILTPDLGTSITREMPCAEAYLPLYRAVGDHVKWDHRLRMSRDELTQFLNAASTHVYVLRRNNEAVGLCEFEGVGRPDIELVHFGVVPAIQGRGLGRYLLDRALRAVWSYGPRRIWLHTDTNDHRNALATYMRAGFEMYRRQVETFPD
ncbi:GNAT family N-acetyltransferase [Gluconacetobacter tumulisoli]|uniref:GNAT family N-acetyltransferase n=1 Tax=Gluconacetobacter tumulisoli TaxID=1286189 RepID=A0A7W4PLP0_9PROT|nr:GNAT family N-acetyltransferase [Gluconacetobacter tumulisoli]MBB2202073.1 GNAT family N-acetyltransferase [Gluconacetobacter tumulisoli]